MPNWVLTRQERESLTATSMLKDPFTVDMKLWTPFQTRLIKRGWISQPARHHRTKSYVTERSGPAAV